MTIPVNSTGNGDEDAFYGRYGERLLPQVVQAIAERDPSRVWASIPVSSDMTDGFRDITFSDMLHSIDYMCWWLEERLGPSYDFETVAYMGPSDMRYSVMLVAAMKCQYQLLFPSGRNSVAGNLSLLETTKCKIFLHSNELASRISELKRSKSDLDSFVVPSFSQMLTGDAKPYAYDKSFREAVLDPALICHTSGSTGAPKPIYLPHGTFSVLDNHRRIPQVQGRKNQDYSLFDFVGGGRFYTTFPPFHAAGMHAYAAIPVFYNSTLVLGPPSKPPSGELASHIMKLQTLRAIYTAPAVLEGLVKEPGGLEQAAKLDFVKFSGGPLAPSAGDSLSEVTDVCQVIGQTETGIIPALVPERITWSYFEWQPFYGVQMEPAGEGLYEMVIPQNKELSPFQTTNYTFPDTPIWRTKDLYTRHPENAKLWRFHGRKDDIIVLSNGEKFNPVTMEGIIQGHPLVSGALIVGTARFQAALLIEPNENVSMTDEALIDEVWPSIQKANEYGPAHAQIFRTKVGVASRGKPFHRAGKGTVVRSKTGDEYREEIEALYARKATYKDEGLQELKHPRSRKDLDAWVRKCMAYFLAVPDGDDLDSTDFFVLGLDSLKTAELINVFKSCLRSYLDDRRLSLITAKAIYANSNIGDLTTYLDELLNPRSDQENRTSKRPDSRVSVMEAMIARHTENLPQRHSRLDSTNAVNGANGVTSVEKLTVALTGSTGSLGTHILEALLQDPTISKIYCLNRSADAQERQQNAFKAKGLLLDLSKAAFIKTEFGLSQLGLTESTFRPLSNTVDLIIHNAWKVDFNHPLPSFETVHIRGVRNLIDWSISSPRRPHIYFVSSVSSVGNWAAMNDSSTPIPEIIQHDHNVAMHQGYGESKHVSEQILAAAAEQAGVPATILRIGQIAGPLNVDGGVWNPKEWLPSLIQTSKALGVLPDSLSEIDWIPIDVLARIILDLIHAGNSKNHPKDISPTLQIFNLVNPHISSWSSLIPTIQAHFSSSSALAPLNVIPLSQWVQSLREIDASDPAQLESKSAAKIVEFFEQMEEAFSQGKEMRFTTENGVRISPMMEGLEAVKGEWMGVWLKQWGY